MDLIHMLLYKGMNVFIEGTGNIAIQFWLSSRFMEASLLLIAPLLAFTKRKPYLIFYSYGLLSIIFCSIIFNGFFPVSFIEGQGLTPFKIYSEYTIDVILALAIYILYKHAALVSVEEKLYITLAIIFTMMAEIAFTFYISVYGFSNFIGHILKLFSFWLIFQAIVVINLKRPYAILHASNKRFKNLFEHSEVSIWEEDFSELMIALDELRSGGITSLKQYLSEHQDVAWQLATKIKVINVNEATLVLFKAKSREDFIQRIDMSFGLGAIDVFIDSLSAIWNQQTTFRSEANFKTFDGKEIKAIVSYQLPQSLSEYNSVAVSIIDITQQKDNEAIIRHQANYDFLTGLANRNLFSDRISHALDIAERTKNQLVLLYLDLDGFKHINDSQGHEFGDDLLKQVSQRIIHSVRKSDTVARLGGDEFAVLLPDNNVLQDIEDVVKKILNNLSKPYDIGNIKAYISTCIGITMYPKDGETPTTLLRKADSAMYKAKARGANNFQFFTPEMDLEAHKRMKLEHALRSALKNKELSIHYQPIVNIEKDCISHAEALLRWHNPTLGMIPPSDFIPLAEELGLIHGIGEFVLRNACQQAVVWQNTLPNAPGIAINLSCQQFNNNKIVPLIKSILDESGLTVEKLTLEITESLLMQEEYSPLAQLKQLRELGVELSIDDFGTGYSSLSYLKRFPLTALKIDRSFIIDLPDDHENNSLVKAILLMAESLNLHVIAEGVEEAAQKAFLMNANCKYIQGYLYSKPLPEKEFIEWLINYESSKEFKY